MLISYVAKIINLFACTLGNIILFTSFIGELIISSVLWITSVFINIFNNICNFFIIVYEDNAFILTEIPDSINNLFDTIVQQFVGVLHGIEAVYIAIFTKVNAVFSSVFWSTNAVLLVLSEVIKLLTNTILFLGETTWFIITFIPVHLPNLLRIVCRHVFDSICGLIVSGYMKLLKFTNYLTEVPLESFMGIMSAVIIIRLCVHFKESIVTNISSCYWSLVRNVLYLYYMLYNYFMNPEIHWFTRMQSGDVISASSENSDNLVDADDPNSAADALCVICQERQKTVLTLPCRHICLCTECCRRLYGYQRTCPICRTFIYHSVTVYW